MTGEGEQQRTTSYMHLDRTIFCSSLSSIEYPPRAGAAKPAMSLASTSLVPLIAWVRIARLGV